VNVPEFSPAETKFHAPEAVRRRLNALPPARRCADPAIGSRDWNGFLLAAANPAATIIGRGNAVLLRAEGKI
jgi:hypothetical protein